MEGLRMRQVIAGASLALTLALGSGVGGKAQTVPTTGAGASACALAEALPTCINGVVAGALGGAHGATNRGGPLHANGGRDVDIAAHHGRMLAR
jgi:hypothetical protein